ncbi:MAG: hypothetical protein FJX29_09210 [Alphaproteobacteria bacterium]|nr:hypothetical protein [Alphaproteobacteria bacterium]
MLKTAIVLLCVSLAVANFASRFIPAEMKRAARILSWVLAAYVAFMLLLGVISTYNARMN